MTAPSFLEGSQPIVRVQSEQPSFLQGSQPISRKQPEGSFLRTAVVQPGVGGVSGLIGGYGSMGDLLGIGLRWVGNQFTGRENIEGSGSFGTAAADHFESRERTKQGLREQAEERARQDFEGFDKMERGELSFTEQMALLMGDDDDIAPRPFVLPNIQEVSEGIDELTGGFTTPRTGNERITRQAGEFVGAAALPMPGTSGASLKTLIPAAGGGLLSGAGREAGVGPMGELALALLGTAATGGIQAGAKATPAVAKNLATDFKGTVSRGLSKVPFVRVKGNQLKNDIISAAKAEAIDLPLSAITDNQTLRFLETQLSESSLSGAALDNARKKLATQYVDGVKRAFGEISETAFIDRQAAGTQLKSALADAEAAGAARNTKNYDLAESLIPQGDVTTAPNIVSKIDSLINKLEKTVKPSPEEASTLKYLKGLKDEFFVPVKKDGVQILDAQGKPFARQPAQAVAKEIPAQNLVGLRRSLNDTIDFTTQGGSKKLLRSLPKALEKDIEAYGKRNAEFLAAEQTARREFAEYAKTFRNKAIKNALREETPERLLGLGSQQSSISKVEKALNYLGEENGPRQFDAFRRAKVEDMIKDKIINPKDSQVSYRKAANIFNDSNKTAILKELAGPEGFKRLQNLQKIADGIVQGAEKFANPSKSGAKLADVGAYVYALKSVALSVGTGNPLPMVKAGFTVYAPKLMADIITDRAFIEQLIDVARAGKGSNAQAYYRALEEATRTLQAKVVQFEKQEANDT